MQILDFYLNKITTYRLTLYYLIFLVFYAVFLSLIKTLDYSAFDILTTSLFSVAVCFVSNLIFSKLFKAVTNIESALITGLILGLIIPISVPQNLPFVFLASVFAMGSKYLLTVEKRHIFNPAAIGVVLLAFLNPSYTAIWWVGTPQMLLPVVIGGIILTRKIREGETVLSFLVSYTIFLTFIILLHHPSFESLLNGWESGFIRSALLFFTFVMLVEPATLPSTKKLKMIYAVFTAFLYTTPQMQIGFLFLTPEMALSAGNILSFVVSPKKRLELILKEKQEVSPNVFAFTFENSKDFKFTPGQYLEWTLPHKNADARGNRRYFSIASSPSEDLKLLVRFPKSPSSFKKNLLSLPLKSKISAGQLAGDFVMPGNPETPMVFIAGGVGIAPFISMLNFILEEKIKCDIVLVFINKNEEDIAFTDIFEKAKPLGLKTLYVLTEKSASFRKFNGKIGYLTKKDIKEIIPDFDKRLFYISGPQLMVQNFDNMLKGIGVLQRKIKQDFFPGYSENR